MSHLEPILRPARESDADAIAQLHARSWRASNRGIMSDTYLDGPVFEERHAVWRHRLADGDPRFLTFVAEARDGLHGFICFELDADPVWGTRLDNLHVDPRLCGRGLGDALMRVGIARVLEVAPDKALHLLVFEASAGARRFYERLGGHAESCVPESLPDGTGSVPAIRYVWPTPVTLAKP